MNARAKMLHPASDEDARVSVAEQLGLDPADLEDSMRLLHDLGVDGDEARCFFERLVARHPFDDAALRRHWRDHFGEGGYPWRVLLYVFASIGLAGMAAALFRDAPVWALYLAMLALLAVPAALLSKRRQLARSAPVTVGDVLAAARLGCWPITYPDELDDTDTSLSRSSKGDLSCL